MIKVTKGNKSLYKEATYLKPKLISFSSSSLSMLTTEMLWADAMLTSSLFEAVLSF
jgi:hypothetical protein